MNRLLDISNEWLIKQYKYSMVRDFYTIRGLQGHYHPKYEHNAVNVPSSPFLKRSFFYSTHSMTILKEMWRRCNDGTVYEKEFWTSRNLFFTKISLPAKRSLIEEQPKSIEKKVETETVTFNNEECIYLAQGSKQKVFISKDKSYVIKIPMMPYKLGIEENVTESLTYNKFPSSIFAKCELVENGWLKMEYVEPHCFRLGDDCPDWVSKIAEGQVGYNRDGVLVAYDYGSEI